MVISRKAKGPVELNIKGNRVTSCDRVKYLGLTLDSQLNFHAHVEGAVKKSRQALGQIAWSSRSLPRLVVRKAVESLVVPRVTYLSNAWGGSGKSNIAALQKVQNQAARVIFNLGKFSRARVSPYIAELRWMRVADTVKFRDIVMVKRLIQGAAVMEMAPLELPTHSYGLRQLSGRGFCLPDGSQKKFGYRAVKAHNSLPPEARNLPLGNCFKGLAKAYCAS